MAQAAAVIGIASSLMGAQEKAKAEQQQALASERLGAFQAGIYSENAKTLDEAAQDAIARGDIEAERLQSQGRGLLGAQKAAYASQGVVVGGGGSPEDVTADTRRQLATDVTTIRSNAWQEALGMKAEAAQERRRAGFAKDQGGGQADAYRTQARTTIITGGLRALEQGADYYDKKRRT